MTQIVALGEAVETAGAITYWSLSGDIDLERLREALAIEGVDERLYRGMGITRGEALVRGARACANSRQLVRPMGKRGAWALVQEHVDGDATIDTARENYQGKYNSESDWAASFLDATIALNEVPENLRNYIDFESYARDARMGGDVTFVRHDGDCWVFWNH